MLIYSNTGILKSSSGNGVLSVSSGNTSNVVISGNASNVIIDTRASSSGGANNASGVNAYANATYSSTYTPVVSNAITRLAITATGNLTIAKPTDIGDADLIYFRVLSSGGNWLLNMSAYALPSLETVLTFPYTMSSGKEYHAVVQYSALKSQWQLIQFVGGY